MAITETILITTETKVDHYQVVERVYEGRPARILFSGTRRAAQSGIALDDNPDLLFDYNQRLLEIANAVYPERILVIGGGAFTLPMALLAALPDAKVTVVELDDGLQPLAEKYFGLRSSERLKLIFEDGRAYLENNNQPFDLIVIDVFSELHIPDQFLSMEFVKLARSRVAQGGALAMNIIASYKGRNDGLIKSQIAAYQQSFDRLDVYPAAHGLTSWLPQNLILLAQVTPAQDYKHYIRFGAINTPPTGPDDILVDDPN